MKRSTSRRSSSSTRRPGFRDLSAQTLSMRYRDWTRPNSRRRKTTPQQTVPVPRGNRVRNRMYFTASPLARAIWNDGLVPPLWQDSLRVPLPPPGRTGLGQRRVHDVKNENPKVAEIEFTLAKSSFSNPCAYWASNRAASRCSIGSLTPTPKPSEI